MIEKSVMDKEIESNANVTNVLSKLTFLVPFVRIDQDPFTQIERDEISES